MWTRRRVAAAYAPIPYMTCTVDIKRQVFGHGYSVYIIRLMRDKPDAPSFNLLQNGSVQLQLKFTDTTINRHHYRICLILRLVKIDRERNITMDC